VVTAATNRQRTRDWRRARRRRQALAAPLGAMAPDEAERTRLLGETAQQAAAAEAWLVYRRTVPEWHGG
jgi:hypothetical protein